MFWTWKWLLCYVTVNFDTEKNIFRETKPAQHLFGFPVIHIFGLVHAVRTMVRYTESKLHPIAPKLI